MSDTIDFKKPYGEVFGSTTGIRYEQNGRLYNTHGKVLPKDILDKLINKSLDDIEAKRKSEVEKPIEAEVVTIDNEKAKLVKIAKGLNIKSPHLFGLEKLKLKIEKAKLAN